MDNKVRIITATKLDTKLKMLVEKKIKKAFPDSKGVFYEMDSKLIAGIKITYKDYEYEDSLLGNLKKL